MAAERDSLGGGGGSVSSENNMASFSIQIQDKTRFSEHIVRKAPIIANLHVMSSPTLPRFRWRR